MDLNRRGVAAMVDAVVFLGVLSIVAGMLFAGSSAFDDDAPYAEEVCHSLFSVKLSLSDVHDTDDRTPVSIPDLAAGYLRTGKGGVMAYIEEALGVLSPSGYLMTFQLDGAAHSLGSGGDSHVSAFSGSIVVMGGGTMEYRLETY